MLTIVTPELMMKGELMQEGQSKRIWKETLAPKYLHDVLGVYKQCKAISRGYPKDASYLIENTRQMSGTGSGLERKENTDMV